MLVQLSAQNNGGEVDSNLVKVEKSKPGFLSLFNDPADTNAVQDPISEDSSAVISDSLIETTDIDSKKKSNKFYPNKFERFEDLQIKYLSLIHI